MIFELFFIKCTILLIRKTELLLELKSRICTEMHIRLLNSLNYGGKLIWLEQKHDLYHQAMLSEYPK